MIANKIKMLRERHNLTQSDLAKKLGLTRSGVNAWEMGISVPSTQYIVELAALFGVSTDYLLDIEKEKSININGLSEKEVGMIIELVEYFKQNKQK
ncbi:MAG: helix-turn-helix transcriptional regulator [Clostridiales bacterium]|nr:helix-turn-helix transcriptional regulator [Clostridiales bacterium]